jgi:hypothetical protein
MRAAPTSVAITNSPAAGSGIVRIANNLFQLFQVFWRTDAAFS